MIGEKKFYKGLPLNIYRFFINKQGRFIWNRKVPTSTLRRWIKLIKVKKTFTMYQDPLNFWLCPKCGCTKTKVYYPMGNIYPECYAIFNCSKCNWKVATIDNSPIITCYSFKDYLIDF